MGIRVTTKKLGCVNNIFLEINCNCILLQDKYKILLLSTGFNFLIYYFSLDILIQGFELRICSKGTVCKLHLSCPISKKCFPTAVVSFSFIEPLCSLKRSTMLRPVSPIYCGLFEAQGLSDY